MSDAKRRPAGPGRDRARLRRGARRRARRTSAGGGRRSSPAGRSGSRSPHWSGGGRSSVISIEPADGGWRVGVEVVEDGPDPGLRRTSSAFYEVLLDADGDLVSYRRTGPLRAGRRQSEVRAMTSGGMARARVAPGSPPRARPQSSQPGRHPGAGPRQGHRDRGRHPGEPPGHRAAHHQDPAARSLRWTRRGRSASTGGSTIPP